MLLPKDTQNDNYESIRNEKMKGVMLLYLVQPLSTHFE